MLSLGFRCDPEGNLCCERCDSTDVRLWRLSGQRRYHCVRCGFEVPI